MADDMARPDLLWRQYQLHVDLYKFYMDLTLKGNAFFYVLTGGILTFYFANGTSPLLRFSLLLPALLAAILGGMCFYGAHLMSHVRAELFAIRDELSLTTAPDVKVLSVLLLAFGVTLWVVMLAMVALVWWSPATRA